MISFDFSDRVAVITGGASGMGLAAADRILDGGGAVVAWDRDSQALEFADQRASGRRWISRRVDVTNYEAVTEAVSDVMATHGRIDILINSAGIAGQFASAAEYPLKEWDRVLDVNLTGVFYCCRAVLPVLVERDYGRIVNVASIAGKEGNPRQVAYSAAKAGVIGLTKSLGKEYAETGIRINAIAPGAFDTPMAAQVSDDDIALLASKIPVGRLGHLDEVSAMLAWIVSEECSFTTGFTFDISGGRGTY